MWGKRNTIDVNKRNAIALFDTFEDNGNRKSLIEAHIIKIQTKKYKQTSTTHNTEIWILSRMNCTNKRIELRCSGRISNAFSISSTIRGTLVIWTNPVINHEWGKELIVVICTTKGTYMWSLMIYISYVLCISWNTLSNTTLSCVEQDTGNLLLWLMLSSAFWSVFSENQCVCMNGVFCQGPYD